MIRLIRAVSFRRWRSLPKALIQGLSLFVSPRNFSARASEINARSGMPRSAARDLARRKMPSGISKVVFLIETIVPYLWEIGQEMDFFGHSGPAITMRAP